MKGLLKRIKEQKGFTLVEILVVIAVLGILVAVLAPNLFSNVDGTRIQADELIRDRVQQAADAYEIAEGSEAGSWSDLINAGYIDQDPNTVKQNSSGSFTISGGNVTYTP